MADNCSVPYCVPTSPTNPKNGATLRSTDNSHPFRLPVLVHPVPELARLNEYPRNMFPIAGVCAKPAALIISSARTIAMRFSKVVSLPFSGPGVWPQPRSTNAP